MIHPKISEFVGNENSRKKVVEWLVRWSDGSKPLLLVGQPGVGKTSFVHALLQTFPGFRTSTKWAVTVYIWYNELIFLFRSSNLQGNADQEDNSHGASSVVDHNADDEVGILN